MGPERASGGGPGITPVITKLGINFENGSGHFDCLALMPTPAAGMPGAAGASTTTSCTSPDRSLALRYKATQSR